MLSLGILTDAGDEYLFNRARALEYLKSLKEGGESHREEEEKGVAMSRLYPNELVGAVHYLVGNYDGHLPGPFVRNFDQEHFDAMRTMLILIEPEGSQGGYDIDEAQAELFLKSKSVDAQEFFQYLRREHLHDHLPGGKKKEDDMTSRLIGTVPEAAVRLMEGSENSFAKRAVRDQIEPEVLQAVIDQGGMAKSGHVKVGRLRELAASTSPAPPEPEPPVPPVPADDDLRMSGDGHAGAHVADPLASDDQDVMPKTVQLTGGTFVREDHPDGHVELEVPHDFFREGLRNGCFDYDGKCIVANQPVQMKPAWDDDERVFELVLAGFQRNALLRPTPTQLLAVLNHPGGGLFSFNELNQLVVDGARLSIVPAQLELEEDEP
jgi:hypothetical protein